MFMELLKWRPEIYHYQKAMAVAPMMGLPCDNMLKLPAIYILLLIYSFPF
jgi:hypothetical protein